MSEIELKKVITVIKDHFHVDMYINGKLETRLFSANGANTDYFISTYNVRWQNATKLSD